MNSSSPTKYFDLHMQGVGYLNRPREVAVKRSKPFLACTIAALNGPADEVEYVYIDMKVVGQDAEDLIRQCIPAVEAKSKVLLGFKAGDPWIDSYEKNGETRTQFKARLIRVSWIKIDGKLVYSAHQDPATEAEDRGPEVPLPSAQVPEPPREQEIPAAAEAA